MVIYVEVCVPSPEEKPQAQPTQANSAVCVTSSESVQVPVKSPELKLPVRVTALPENTAQYVVCSGLHTEEEALLWEALLWDALLWYALLWDALLWEALLWDALLWEALLWDALLWDALDDELFDDPNDISYYPS